MTAAVTATQRRDFALFGATPREVEHPGSPEAVAAVLRRAGTERRSVVPWGAGTKQHLGNAPRSYDLALDLSALDGVAEYEPADLVVTAGAATSLATLQRHLAASGQFLALDPPYAEQCTLGGMLATNVSGPSRLLYGTARDLVIGLRTASPEGTVVKSGGKVVKNVVGYDLNKLHIGGFGTAGVIVEATFKVHPLPAAEATVRATFADVETAHAAAGRIARSVLYPRAVDIVRGLDPDAGGHWQVLIWAAGSPATVERQVRDAAAWCREGAASRVERLDGGAHQAAWAIIREFAPAGGDAGGDSDNQGEATQHMVVLRLSCLPSQVPALIVAIERATAVPSLVVRAGNGVVWLRLPDADASTVRTIAQSAATLGGTAVVEAAPRALRRSLDVWDPAGLAAERRDDFDLMRAIKSQFDPQHILNPGRFVAGI